MVSLHQVAKLWSFGFSNSFLMNVTRLFPLRLTVWISLKSKALSRVFCSTPQFKSNNSPVLSLLYGSTLFLTWIQVYQESGKVVWYSYLSQNFPQFLVTHIVKGFSVVSKAEVDVFLELPCFLWFNECWQLSRWKQNKIPLCMSICDEFSKTWVMGQSPPCLGLKGYWLC